VEVSAYEDLLNTEMLANGYKGYFKPKARAHFAGIDLQKVFFFFITQIVYIYILKESFSFFEESFLFFSFFNDWHFFSSPSPLLPPSLFQKVDGCCIFYKSNKLRLLETHVVEFQQFALRSHEMFCGGPGVSGYDRLLSKDNISVFALLEFVGHENSGEYFYYYYFYFFIFFFTFVHLWNSHNNIS
jgi:mRNA deadenylase 3'-5' endonuclease subunit Ccr4